MTDKKQYPKFWVSTEAPFPFYYLVIIQANSVIKIQVTKKDVERLKEDIEKILARIKSGFG